MLSRVYSCAILGIDGYLVSVETDIRPGLPSFSIVGLPESAVKESKERVSSAIVNSGYNIPLKRITINLAPADIRKSGTGFDLAIAVGILSATGVVNPGRLNSYILLGELALDGSLRKIRGVLSMSIEARNSAMKGIVVPTGNCAEAAIVEGIEVVDAGHLGDVVSFLNSGTGGCLINREEKESVRREPAYDVDMADIKGQETVKRAIEIACAGGHNLLMIGPPGSGKTMLSSRIPTILPAMTLAEQIETTRIHSVVGKLPDGIALLTERPFRSPHHTISDIGLVGGGSIPRPGEISLAHNGVLFLDELPEFRRSALEVMRQPLEEGYVNIARASLSTTYPARFMLVAAMNPCPCGYFTEPSRTCSCSSTDIQRYLSRISGPLLDRIDIHIDVPSVRVGDLLATGQGEQSDVIGRRVQKAREIQAQRLENSCGKFCNAHMSAKEARSCSNLHPESLTFLRRAMDKLGLSARAFHRIIKVARTIADLEHDEMVKSRHIAEAVQYRTLDRALWRYTS
ncbi:MAG: YifB family Mg chelatase-like AAA ATPase [Candidatus Glassbacteria bacterium]